MNVPNSVALWRSDTAADNNYAFDVVQWPVAPVQAPGTSTLFTFSVPTTRSHTIAYGGSCSATAFFFVEANAQFDPDADGNAARVVPSSTRTADANCQSLTSAAFTLTNNGNVDINVDGNFSSAFSGTDVNLVLKGWMGDGTGCGIDGLRGWQEPCSVTSTTAPVTFTTCKKWNSSNATAASRLVTKLLVGDTNQLCFSGDFNGFVGNGDHNKTFQSGSDFS